MQNSSCLASCLSLSADSRRLYKIVLLGSPSLQMHCKWHFSRLHTVDILLHHFRGLMTRFGKASVLDLSPLGVWRLSIIIIHSATRGSSLVVLWLETSNETSIIMSCYFLTTFPYHLSFLTSLPISPLIHLSNNSRCSSSHCIIQDRTLLFQIFAHRWLRSSTFRCPRITSSQILF